MVAPSEFIPVAEQSGLITEIGGAVLRKATGEAATWSVTGGPRPYVSVNLAGAQIQRDEIVDEVAAAVAAAGIAPADLMLELTETGLIQDTQGNERRLRELRDLGVRLAIDDFGTGYSSLSYLQRFSMDVLKIDKSFVDPLNIGARNPLVDAMITIARSLSLKVVAEGIETPGQMFALQERGCRMGQGFLFSEPVPADEARMLLAGKPLGAPVTPAL